jgi:translation initiation factor 1
MSAFTKIATIKKPTSTNPLNAGLGQPIFNDINNFDFENGAETADNLKLLDSVHIRIQQRTGKKVITIIQGLDAKIPRKDLIKKFKTMYACGGHISYDEEFGEVIQLTGDQRFNVRDYLIDNSLVEADKVELHG